MPTQIDIDRLVAAALNYVLQPDEAIKHSDFQRLAECVQPFRTKKSRVGTLTDKNGVLCSGTKAIELTDEVKRRLSETAGVDAREVSRIVFEPVMAIEKKPSAIMALIAKGKVDYE
jgi:hypothetical protein